MQSTLLHHLEGGGRYSSNAYEVDVEFEVDRSRPVLPRPSFSCFLFMHASELSVPQALCLKSHTRPCPPPPPSARITFYHPFPFFRFLLSQSHAATHAADISGGNYLSPLFPWPQAVALWVNWFLVCQLPLPGLLALLAYVALAAAHYACYGAARSVGNCTGWSLLLAGAATARAPADRCLSLSADALENSLMVGDGGSGGGVNDASADGGCLSPTARQPLLTPEEDEEESRRRHSLSAGSGKGTGTGEVAGLGAGGGGGDDDDVAPSPIVTVLPNSQRSTPSSTPSREQLQLQHRHLVRRRSQDANSFRSST